MQKRARAAAALLPIGGLFYVLSIKEEGEGISNEEGNSPQPHHYGKRLISAQFHFLFSFPMRGSQLAFLLPGLSGHMLSIRMFSFGQYSFEPISGN
jgi:hypothetical protein